MEDLLYCEDLHGLLKRKQVRSKKTSEMDWKKFDSKVVGYIR